MHKTKYSNPRNRAILQAVIAARHEWVHYRSCLQAYKQSFNFRQESYLEVDTPDEARIYVRFDITTHEDDE